MSYQTLEEHLLFRAAGAKIEKFISNLQENLSKTFYYLFLKEHYQKYVLNSSPVFVFDVAKIDTGFTFQKFLIKKRYSKTSLS